MIDYTHIDSIDSIDSMYTIKLKLLKDFITLFFKECSVTT